jgi:hypothetical protein
MGMSLLRICLLVVFSSLFEPGLALGQGQPETLSLAIGSEGFSVTVADLEKMPQAQIVTTTPFMPGKTRFDGVLLRDLLKAANLTASQLKMTALNDYQVEVPSSDAAQYDVIVAYKVDGQYMRVRDKGPFWLIYPMDQHSELQNEATATKMIWQMTTIEGE